MEQVDLWQIDMGNVYHVTQHGVTEQQLEQVLTNAYHVSSNRKGRTATHILIGQDDGGACITVAMLRTSMPGQWRPVAAWYCKPHEWARLPRR